MLNYITFLEFILKSLALSYLQYSSITLSIFSYLLGENTLV